MEFVKNLIPDLLIKEYRTYKKQKELRPFRGDKVFCPICKSGFNSFAPWGSPERKNAKCRNCSSLERHRLLYLYFNNKTNLFDGSEKRLLHFAPEKSFYNIFSEKKYIEYIPCDLFPEQYIYYDKKVKIRKVDITNISFEDNFFDIILCNHVLEHIPDDIQAMKEMYRVMKKGGWGILSVPIDYSREKTYEDFTITAPEERVKAFGQHDHVRWYGKDYKERLKSAGFKVTEDDYVKKFSPEELFRFGLNPKHIIYYCEK